MEKSKIRNRYVILGALFVNSFCIGGIYAWSVFSAPLAAARGWDYGSVTMAYSLMLLMIAVVGIPSGNLLDQFGPRKLMIFSSACFGFGWILTGFAPNLPALYLFFGIFCGGGSGLRYNPCITTAVRWFPDRKGLASGLVVGAMGLAPLALAPIANVLLTRYDVLAAFKILGFFFFIFSAMASVIVDMPPAGWHPEGYVSPSSLPNDGGVDCGWPEMMRSKVFYVMWIIFLGSCVAGLMLIGHASTIGQEVAHITSAQAALLVGILALANFSGRMLMGVLSDIVGRYKTLLICLAICSVDMFLLPHIRGFVAFVIAIVVVGATFGGVLSIFPAIVSETFGLKHMGVNYGIMFTAYGIASILGPLVASTIRRANGNYVDAFTFAGVCSLLSFFLVIYLRALKKRSHK